MSAASSLPEHLERRAEERARPDWVAVAQADPLTRYVLTRGTAHLVQRHDESAAITFLDSRAAAELDIEGSQSTLLGWFGGRRCVLLQLPEQASFQPPGRSVFEELRPLLGSLPEGQARLLSYARALVIWRARHRFCGACGAPTLAHSAGHVLICSACGTHWFPRIDPAVIVLVSDGERALLGRQAAWPPGRYSALAGFVEPGESLEEAVRREVFEETGARVGAVRYFDAQPWPFPASLMIGFRAEAPQEPIRLDGELEDARWFERSELRAGQAPLLPPRYTIARRLIEAWLHSD